MTDTTRPSNRPLTLTDAVTLATIVEASIRGTYVGRLTESGDVVHGTARSIGSPTGAFAGPDDDIRDMYLRVSTSNGLEAFWAVSELMAEIPTGEFVAPFDRPAYDRATAANLPQSPTDPSPDEPRDTFAYCGQFHPGSDAEARVYHAEYHRNS